MNRLADFLDLPMRYIHWSFSDLMRKLLVYASLLRSFIFTHGLLYNQGGGNEDMFVPWLDISVSLGSRNIDI